MPIRAVFTYKSGLIAIQGFRMMTTGTSEWGEQREFNEKKKNKPITKWMHQILHEIDANLVSRFSFFPTPHHPFNSGFCSIFRAKHSLRIHRICIFKNTLICTRPNCFNRFESICQPHCIPIDIFSAVAHTTESSKYTNENEANAWI